MVWVPQQLTPIDLHCATAPLEVMLAILMYGLHYSTCTCTVPCLSLVIQVYRRSMNATVPSDLDINTLKHEVTEAVEDAVSISGIARL